MTRKAFVFLMLVLTSIITTNSVFNTHSHILPDGSVEVHAHPFNKSNESEKGQHTHSEVELILIHNFNVLYFLLLLVIPFVLVFRKTIFYDLRLTGIIVPVLRYQPGRAPPYLM